MKISKSFKWLMGALALPVVLCAANLTFSNLAPQDTDPAYVLQQKLVAAINANTIARAQQGGVTTGSGSPEGVTTQTPGKLYLDTAGKGFYVKLTGSGNTGWALVTAF